MSIAECVCIFAAALPFPVPSKTFPEKCPKTTCLGQYLGKNPAFFLKSVLDQPRQNTFQELESANAPEEIFEARKCLFPLIRAPGTPLEKKQNRQLTISNRVCYYPDMQRCIEPKARCTFIILIAIRRICHNGVSTFVADSFYLQENGRKVYGRRFKNNA